MSREMSDFRACLKAAKLSRIVGITGGPPEPPRSRLIRPCPEAILTIYLCTSIAVFSVCEWAVVLFCVHCDHVRDCNPCIITRLLPVRGSTPDDIHISSLPPSCPTYEEAEQNGGRGEGGLCSRDSCLLKIHHRFYSMLGAFQQRDLFGYYRKSCLQSSWLTNPLTFKSDVNHLLLLFHWNPGQSVDSRYMSLSLFFISLLYILWVDRVLAPLQATVKYLNNSWCLLT